MPPRKKPKASAAKQVKVKVEKKSPTKRKTAPAATKKTAKVQKVEPVKKEDKDDEKQMKTVTFTGAVPIDEQCKQCQTGYHVFKDGSGYYNGMLNQTNIGQNNNKYYMLQLLEPNTPNALGYCIWFRWGRVGKIGGTTFKNNLSQATAINKFTKKFADKTKNSWIFRSSFTKKKGQYELLEMDYGEDDKSNVKVKKDPTIDARKDVPSKLHEDVQDLVKTIFNVSEYEESVKEMEFDVKKAPLGKLTTKQIKAGYEALKKIEECINKDKPLTALQDACSEFYTKIPHDFGMKVPPLIRTSQQLKKKVELLETLGDIQIAMEIIDNTQDSDINELDAYYKSLECDLEPLDEKDPDYKMIEKFLKTTHGSTHMGYNMALDKVFIVKKEKNEKAFKKQLGNRMLLWHGSRLTNWCGILKQGLRIAPPEAPVSGYMFGKGVYFADMSSKSANYCHASRRQPYGMLLLSEVALGTPNEKTSGDYNANKLPKGKHSTKGLGQFIPDKKNWQKLPCGTLVPLGKQIRSGVSNTYLYYNEYIVYDVAQIRPRYLIKTKFKF